MATEREGSAPEQPTTEAQDQVARTLQDLEKWIAMLLVSESESE